MTTATRFRASSKGPSAPTSGGPGELETPRQVLPQARRENFPVAFALLPPRARRELRAIYGYARLVDDAGDEARGDRTALLDWLEADVDRLFEGKPEHPLLGRLVPVVRRHSLPREPFLDLIEANRRDQSVSRYPTFDDLVGYCRLSANPVGRLVLGVMDAGTPERVAASDAVCTALQLAEHWQDVAEDYRRGRIYLPLEDMARFGVGESDLAAPPAGEALRRLLAFEVERARELLGAGVGLVRSLSGWRRLAIAGYVGGGRAALAAIEAAGYDALSGPPRPSRLAKLRGLNSVLAEARA